MYKLVFLSSLICLFLFGCKENTAEETVTEGLSTDLVNNPRTMNGAVQDSSLGKLLFKDTVYDFGKIKAGKIVSHTFSFVNSGKRDIIINDAKGSCGCTVPEYPTQPIKPGDSGIIKVTFNSEGKHGFNDKNVAIFTNGLPSAYQLFIQAAVE